MTEVSDEEVVAFVDGRLAGEPLLAFQTRMSRDLELADRVAAHRWMARQIVAAYGEPPGDSVDHALIARLGLSEGNVIDLAGLRHPAARQFLRTLAISTAIAASLVAGLFIGNMIGRPAAPWLQTGAAGQLTAGGELAEGLSNELSAQSGPVRIGISFRASEGVCRTFSSPGGLSGLGCRENGQWTIPIVVAGPAKPDEATEYSVAGGDVAPSVMAEVDRRMVGEPLSLREEKTLKAKGWQ